VFNWFAARDDVNKRIAIHFDTHAYASSSRIGGLALMGAGKRRWSAITPTPARAGPRQCVQPDDHMPARSVLFPPFI
jgi:hypothetical protein